MNKKVILGIGLLAAGAAFYFKDSLFPSSAANTGNQLPSGNTGGNTSGSQHQYEGMVLTANGNAGWYKVINGKRVVYQEYQAYLNDSSPKMINIPLAELNAIPMDMTRYIAVNGFVNEKPNV